MDDQSSGLRLYVWAMGALALVTGIWVIIDWQGLAEAETIEKRDRLTAATDFADMASTVQKLASETIDPALQAERREKGNFQQFLEKAAKEAGIEPGTMTIGPRQEDRRTKNKFVEISYSVKIPRASRRQIADFCYRVEYYRDYLKIRSLTLHRMPKSTADVWKDTIVRVAFREPLKKKK